MDLILHNEKVITNLSKALTNELKSNISYNNILDALFMLWSDKYAMEWKGDLWDKKIDFEDTLNSLKVFDFSTFENELCTDAYLIEDIVLYQRKVRIKCIGTIWEIHRYDADPFPSNPHAHNLDDNIKLDLSNGKCYRVRKYLKTINRKDLLSIREQAKNKFKGELPPLEI